MFLLDFLRVEIPKGKYNGQKLIDEVRMNATATMPAIIAKVPEITPVKYNTAINTATDIRMPLSTGPIFFFIRLFFVG